MPDAKGRNQAQVNITTLNVDNLHLNISQNVATESPQIQLETLQLSHNVGRTPQSQHVSQRR